MRKENMTNIAPLPSNWRERLPNPAEYYREHIPQLTPPDTLGVVHGRCPFHTGNNPALTIDTEGTWRCHGKCGGGDLVEFAIRLKAFNETVLALIGVDA